MTPKANSRPDDEARAGTMQFKDYYEILGVARDAGAEDIKRAYRKLARKYHPDVSKLSDAEARFKDVGEAYEVLKDPEKRAAYDALGERWREAGAPRGEEFQPPPGWDAGFEFGGEAADFGEFFEGLFGRRAQRAHRAAGMSSSQGEDHHAKVLVDLEDAYRGATRTISLRMPVVDARGRMTYAERRLDVTIPKGVREGQHLRLSGQGSPGFGGGPPGDLYLEIAFRPHALYRVSGRDVSLELPVAPWEAALGAQVTVPTPDGAVQLTVPPGSSSGKRLRLKGKGIPGNPPGDLYVVLTIALPPADTEQARELYRRMAETMRFDPRRSMPQ